MNRIGHLLRAGHALLGRRLATVRLLFLGRKGRCGGSGVKGGAQNHPHLTTEKTLYVEISRARDRAELVTDDRDALRERLEAVSGERIGALEAIEPEKA